MKTIGLLLITILLVSGDLLGQNTVLYIPGGQAVSNSPGNTHLQVNGFSKFATSNDRSHTWLPFINGSSYISSYTPLGEGNIIFRTDDGANYIEHLRIIGSTGKVGIGTPLPQARLHVVGGGASNIDLIVSGRMMSDNADGGLWCGTGNTFVGGHETNKIGFWNQGWRVSVLNNGDVGIGTTSPDAKLTVKGDIHTREVRVDMAGSVAGDYVFEKDYNLLPLSELETYINANKHLPEVPSAKEFEANGLNLKEMNLILLKKVEELTLHLIEQNKKIELYHQENLELKKELKEHNN